MENLEDQILIVCNLYKNAVRNSDPTVLNEWKIVNNDMERMWKEAVMD